MQNKPDKPNIKTIAQLANVSMSTVSRALRSNSNVSHETREKILKIAEELGYMPNKAAQMLVGNRTDSKTSLISIVYDATITMKDYYFSKVIHSIVDEAAASDLVTTISSITDHYQSILAFAQQLKDSLNAGLILVGNISDKAIGIFREHNPNTVIVDKPSRLVTSVYNDNEWGAYQATCFLARKGFTRITLLESYPNHYFTESVRSGYQHGLKDSSLDVHEELCVDGEYHISNGYKPMQRLLAGDNPPDAVIANDEMSVGALKAIREAELRVPQDISIFGFDNLSIGQHVDPPLSTVGVNYDHMARTAVRKILENIKNGQIIPVQIIIPVQLIHRKSVRE